MPSLPRRYWPAIPIAAVFVGAVFLEWSHAHGPRQQTYAAAPQNPAAALSQPPTVSGRNALPAPTVRPAIDGVLAAFQSHSLVGMGNWEGGDNHDLAQQEDFYAALVRDPRFARNVGNVVVEFGDASAQGIIDRYVDGQAVPYTELRKVWTDTVGYTIPPFNLGYVNFFAQVRATNLSLPPARRIHVWLGDPPVDWSKVKKREDVVPSGDKWFQFRDNYAADLIERQILSRGRKALLIFGGFHLLRDPVLLETRPGYSSMAELVERQQPGVIFSIYTYVGFFANKPCAIEFEKDKTNLPAPVLLAPVRGTTLDDPAFRQRCPPPAHAPPPNTSEEKAAEIADHAARWFAGLNDDALLYFGPAASLTESPILPDAYLDNDYLKEIMRHWPIRGDDGATPSNQGMTVDKNPASPRPFKP
jgi:hypothetical protein